MNQAGSCYVCPILHRKIDGLAAALSAAEERERVLREALEYARDEVLSRSFERRCGLQRTIEQVLAIPAPEQSEQKAGSK